MLEIGGYRELDLRTGNEYYKGNSDIARLNSARAGIYHALCLLNCKKILIPFYQCQTVRDFLLKHDIEIEYYSIDKTFKPLLTQEVKSDTAILFVNYFGLLSEEEGKLADKYEKVIFDHTQAFFAPPVKGGYTVYSPRKFFGVSDGCYVIGENAELYVSDYEEDYSGETSSFLLKRIESGGNNNYSSYCKNEERINQSDIRRMSKLTRALLDNIDYEEVKNKRTYNFLTAKRVFSDINLLPEQLFDDSKAIPMVYPLMIKKNNLRNFLKEKHIYVGQWWKYLLKEMPEDSFEVKCARFLIPIQIDHRYQEEHIIYTRKVIEDYLQNNEKGTD